MGVGVGEVMKKTALQKLEKLLSIGQTFSNVAYNLAQDPALSQDYRERLEMLQERWDNEKQWLRDVEGLKV